MKYAVAIVVFCACLASLTLAQGWGVNGSGRVRRILAAMVTTTTTTTTSTTTTTTQPSWTDPYAGQLYHWYGQTNFIRGTQVLVEASINTNNAVKRTGSEYQLEQLTNTYRVEQVVQFNGTRDYVCSNIPALNGTNYAIGMWIYPQNNNGGLNPAGASRLFSQLDAAGNHELDLIYDTNTSFGVVTYQGGYGVLYGVAKLPINTAWYHVFMSVTGTLCKTYVNGVLDNSGTVKTVTLTTGVALGNFFSSGSQFYNGKMFDIHVYQRGLSSSEVYNVWQYTAPTNNIEIR